MEYPLENVKAKELTKKAEKIFTAYLDEHNYRKTPERYSILEEIYTTKKHFDIDTLYFNMKEKKSRVSKATIYNTIEHLLACKLIRKHQFGENGQSHYEKAYFDTQHDHIILVDTGEIIEFCDPRIHSIKSTIEELFNLKIESHSLYLYGKRKK